MASFTTARPPSGVNLHFVCEARLSSQLRHPGAIVRDEQALPPPVLLSQLSTAVSVIMLLWQLESL